MALWLQRFTIPFRNQSCWFATSNASRPSILALLVPRHISLAEFDSSWVTQEVPKPPRPPHSPHRCWDTQDVYQTGRGNCRNTSRGPDAGLKHAVYPVSLFVSAGAFFFFYLHSREKSLQRHRCNVLSRKDSHWRDPPLSAFPTL